MNVRPGDIAVIVKAWGRTEFGCPSLEPTVGKFVKVTKGQICDLTNIHYWLFESPIPLAHPWRVIGLPDDCLRPIRDSDAPDETLSWAKVPKPSFESLSDQMHGQPAKAESWMDSRPWMRPAKQTSRGAA